MTKESEKKVASQRKASTKNLRGAAISKKRRTRTVKGRAKRYVVDLHPPFVRMVEDAARLSGERPSAFIRRMAVDAAQGLL
jgi:hypothetical protein